MEKRPTKHKRRKPSASPTEFKEGLELGFDGTPSAQNLAHTRRLEKEHRSALARYRKAHRTRYPGLDAVDVEAFWSSAIRDLLEAYCLHRINPCDGALWAFADHVHDALLDYDMYGRAAAVEDEIIARTVGFVGHVYKLVLRRSDAEKASRGKFEAAQLTPNERGIQECEITHGLQALGFDLSDSAKRSRILDALIASADEIRFYPIPEEAADEDEDVGRESIHRGAAQAAAQNVGKILPDLRAPRGVGGLVANHPLGERTVMARKAAAKRRDLRGPSPTRLIEAAADAVLRDEFRGDQFAKAMAEIADFVDRKFEEQRRIDEERES